MVFFLFVVGRFCFRRSGFRESCCLLKIWNDVYLERKRKFVWLKIKKRGIKEFYF